MTPIFIGPRQITASSWLPQQEAEGHDLQPAEIDGNQSVLAALDRLPLEAQHGRDARAVDVHVQQPDALSRTSARAAARFTATVLLPTPPLPDSTTILCRMRQSRDCSFRRSSNSCSLSSFLRREAEQSVSLQVSQVFLSSFGVSAILSILLMIPARSKHSEYRRPKGLRSPRPPAPASGPGSRRGRTGCGRRSSPPPGGPCPRFAPSSRD